MGHVGGDVNDAIKILNVASTSGLTGATGQANPYMHVGLTRWASTAKETVVTL